MRNCGQTGEEEARGQDHKKTDLGEGGEDRFCASSRGRRDREENLGQDPE